MNDLISREELIKEVCGKCDGACDCCCEENCIQCKRPNMRCDFRKDLDDAPTVDAVPVVHGEWIYHECVSSYDGTKSGYSCSRCCAFVTEETFDMDYFHKEFCGHCGAKMDGGNEE